MPKTDKAERGRAKAARVATPAPRAARRKPTPHVSVILDPETVEIVERYLRSFRAKGNDQVSKGAVIRYCIRRAAKRDPFLE